LPPEAGQVASVFLAALGGVAPGYRGRHPAEAAGASPALPFGEAARCLGDPPVGQTGAGGHREAERSGPPGRVAR